MNIYERDLLKLQEKGVYTSLKEHVSLFRSKCGKDLKAPNIANSCRTNKPYKGLLFSYRPL